jgi:hypothetical protein
VDADPLPVDPSEFALLRRENERLSALVTELQEKLAAALAENERLRKGGPGGAAPFSRGQRKAQRKKPGRKPGQGLFTSRPAPDYTQCDVTEAEAPLATRTCPDCGGRLEIRPFEAASTIDVPETPRPQVQRFRVEVARCAGCGKVHRGSHPDLKPDQFGATAHRVGPGVYPLAHWLHYAQGLPVRRIPPLLHQMFRIPLTQGAITQDALRQVGLTRLPALPGLGHPEGNGGPQASPGLDAGGSGGLAASVPSLGARGAEDPPGPGMKDVLSAPGELAFTGPIGRIYLSLRGAVAMEAVVHQDDTVWRIGGLQAWLMVFCSVRLVIYQIRDHHRNEEVREILGQFVGWLVCDRGPSYESRNLTAVPQQKCLSHLIRNIRAVLDYLPGESRAKAEALLGLLREALALWHAYRRGEAHDYAEDRQRIVAEVDRVLEPVSHLNPYLNTLLNGIGRQHDRGHVLRFLDHPEIEPTNNRAERDLRGPVIARKVSQCSRTDAGAEAHAAWSSVVATLVRQGVSDPVRALMHCLATGEIPGLELPPPRLAGPAAPR